jgi:RecJ-like exonuclease
VALPLTKGRTGHRTWNTDEIRARISRSNIDPIETHIRILSDQQHCLACHGDGRVRYELADAKRKACQCVDGMPDSLCWRCDGTGIAARADRVCVSCHGDRRETLTVAQLQASANELMRYTCQQLKQVEHTGTVTHEHQQAVALSKLDPEELAMMERLAKKALLPPDEVVDAEVVN